VATLRQRRFGALLISPVLLLITSLCCGPLQAVPRRLIILRHGEKANAYALCTRGQQRTREAAAQVLSNPTWAGGTVVMAWEHRTIANQQLAERFPDQPVTLRQLLNLDQLQGVPDTWPDDTYGWIWIIDYDNAPYSHLKAPAWGTPVPQADGCLP
jgi:hypothetical protein